jgi:hypothetical protein
MKQDNATSGDIFSSFTVRAVALVLIRAYREWRGIGQEEKVITNASDGLVLICYGKDTCM